MEHDSMTSKRYHEDWVDALRILDETEKCCARMADLLLAIAYPKRGTENELVFLEDASNLIQANFTLDELLNITK